MKKTTFHAYTEEQNMGLQGGAVIEADVSPTAVSSNGTVLAFGSGLSNDSGDDIHNGSVIFCYDGPGKGEWRIITDYDSAGHATGDQACVLNRPFKTLPTTDSVFGILGTATNGSPVEILIGG